MKHIWITLILGLVISGLMSGCSKTWSGVKQDTSTAWKGTKKVVHEATAP